MLHNRQHGAAKYQTGAIIVISAHPKPLERQLSWFSSAAGFLNTDRVASAGLRPGLIVALFYFDRPLKLQALRDAI